MREFILPYSTGEGDIRFVVKKGIEDKMKKSKIENNEIKKRLKINYLLKQKHCKIEKK